MNHKIASIELYKGRKKFKMSIARRVIKAKDIQYFFGKGERMSFKMLQQMRFDLSKKKHQPITISDFCSYYKVNEIEVIQSIEVAQEIEKKENVKIKINQNKGISNPMPTPSSTPENIKQETYFFGKKTN
ncbi:hypothetical protein ACSVH2_09795 [Flavobacterium sp. RSB2_4_14]|uniref:hypothetical protein n=1 Tax=Flavobacterium sp. RSB2_4_14 TaxID=3447665 RepID=UPI003F3D6588